MHERGKVDRQSAPLPFETVRIDRQAVGIRSVCCFLIVDTHLDVCRHLGGLDRHLLCRLRSSIDGTSLCGHTAHDRTSTAARLCQSHAAEKREPLGGGQKVKFRRNLRVANIFPSCLRFSSPFCAARMDSSASESPPPGIALPCSNTPMTLPAVNMVPPSAKRGHGGSIHLWETLSSAHDVLGHGICAADHGNNVCLEGRRVASCLLCYSCSLPPGRYPRLDFLFRCGRSHHQHCCLHGAVLHHHCACRLSIKRTTVNVTPAVTPVCQFAPQPAALVAAPTF